MIPIYPIFYLLKVDYRPRTPSPKISIQNLSLINPKTSAVEGLGREIYGDRLLS